jgi:hypothetical protein
MFPVKVLELNVICTLFYMPIFFTVNIFKKNTKFYFDYM